MKIKQNKLTYLIDNLEFCINDKYKCEVYLMEYDNYCIRIYDKTKDDKELYSCWFDSDLGMVAGNNEIYTDEDIDDVIDTAFNYVDKLFKTKNRRYKNDN